MSAHHVVIFGGSDWWLHNRGSDQRLTDHLVERGWRVLFLNSIGIGLPSPAVKGNTKRILRKLLSLGRVMRKVKGGPFVASPFVIPLWGNALVARINGFLLRVQVAVFQRMAGIRNPVVIAGIPTAASMVFSMRRLCLIYHVKDHYAEYYEEMLFSSVKRDDAVMRQRADAVVCASIGLYEMMRKERGNAYYIPNAASEEFLKCAECHDTPDWFSDIPAPRILYWGQLESAFDSDLMAAVATDKPEWNFCFVGPKTHSYPSLESLPNVRFFPRKSQNELAAAGHAADVLIMPWQQSPWILYSCPIKFREYLAIGKPIVSVPILEVRDAYPGAACIAATKEEWIEAIEEALRENDANKTEWRRSLVRNATWKEAEERMIDVIENVIGKRQCAE